MVRPLLEDARDAALRAAALLVLRRGLLHLAPALGRHAVLRQAAGSAATLVLELSVAGVAVARGRLDASSFRLVARGAAASAAVAVAAGGAGALGGPLLAAGVALGLQLAGSRLAQLERAPAPSPYDEAIEAHVERLPAA